MYRLKQHIIHLILGIILVVLAVANATAQIAIQECDTMTFSVSSRPNIPETHFVWGIYNASPTPTDVLDPATTLDPALYFVDGQYAGRTVKVTGLAPGEYYVRIHVWDEVSCTDNIEMYLMEVLESDLDMEVYADSVCIGDPTNVYIRFTGRGPYTVTYTIGDAVTPSVFNLNGDAVGPEITIPILEPLPEGETTFWVISVDDGCKAYEYPESERPSTGIVIFPKPAQQPIYIKEEN